MSDLSRHKQIIEILRDRPFASVRDLQERLGVSAATTSCTALLITLGKQLMSGVFC